ncbi:hypothetical protein NM688_g5294 [Phlebia brevispora]|uniref:Uncharacterized protein n=1 Tax=Phlebia brevispora TaxID=194682 RepID=A0ACC1SXF4_9APHY|nr:hypothetical protein NM688_g5294 [Phlebia brevispora]
MGLIERANPGYGRASCTRYSRIAPEAGLLVVLRIQHKDAVLKRRVNIPAICLRGQAQVVAGHEGRVEAANSKGLGRAIKLPPQIPKEEGARDNFHGSLFSLADAGRNSFLYSSLPYSWDCLCVAVRLRIPFIGVLSVHTHSYNSSACWVVRERARDTANTKTPLSEVVPFVAQGAFHHRTSLFFSVMRSTTPRHGRSHRETSHAPSAPIPIPSHRRAANRRDEASSPELIFHMSPDADETPLTPLNTTLIFKETGTLLNQRSGFSFASRFGHVKSPSVDLPPYYDEPFMYSIPRLPVRSPPNHARTRSDIVDGIKVVTDEVEHEKDFSQRSTFSASSSSFTPLPSHANHTCCSATSEIAYNASNPLTTAFQNSLSSATSASPPSDASTSVDDLPFTHPLSPPASVRGWKGSSCHGRGSPVQKRKSLESTAAVNGLSRISAAEPVLSFAQAGLNDSVGSDKSSRGVKVPRSGHTSPRQTRSPPYPIVRGRRMTPLCSRLKVSDEDIAGTLEHMDFSEKFGLEKFLVPEFHRRKGSDENVPDNELVERGRTRSRVRSGRRG